MSKVKKKYQDLIAKAATNQEFFSKLMSCLFVRGKSKINDVMLDEKDKQELAKVMPDLLIRFVPQRPVRGSRKFALDTMQKQSVNYGDEDS